MGTFVDRAVTSQQSLLWLDYTQYASRLLAGGRIPWRDTAACVAWYRKAQGLLRSDVVTLPVSDVCADWLGAHPSLGEAMAAKKRAAAPLRTLLADEGLRAQCADLAQALRASFPGTLVVLACPSPRRWVGDAFRQAHRAEVEIGEDETDNAALYIADFARIFADAGLDALLLLESEASEPHDARELACYQSVLNVASQYRWDAGLFAPGGRYTGGGAENLQFVIAPAPPSGALGGLLQPAAFWDDAVPAAAPDPGFHFAEIPAQATPERVLERLALLR